MSGYLRRVSGNEKAMIALNEQRPPFVIQLVLEGYGGPEPAALHDALARATAANPGCAIRLEEGDGGDDWVPGPPPTLTLVEAPGFTAENGEGAPFLLWPLHASVGPTCELLHVRGEAREYLVFRALHAVMDGQGTLLWAHDVLRCLRGEAPVGHPDVLDVRTLYDQARDQRRSRPPHDALRPLGPPAPGPGRAPGWRRVRVPLPLSPTVSGRLAVGLAERARANNDEPGPVRIHLPVDLRCHARAARTTGNLFGSLYLEVEPQATPDQVGLQIVRLLYEQEGRRPLGLYAAGAEVGSLAAHRVRAWRELSDRRAVRRCATSATVSHLGRLDSGLLSGPGWTTTSALFVPPVVDGCSVSVNGVDEHTELTLGLAGGWSPGEIDGLAEALGRALAG